MLERVTLENSDVRIWAHTELECAGDKCSIHKRSKHSMRQFPQHWRSDRGLMERICPHGTGHPDPDHLYYLKLMNSGYYAASVHGCDGCCNAR